MEVIRNLQQGWMDKVRATINTIRQEGLQMDTKTYVYLIKKAMDDKQMGEAIGWLRDMENDGCEYSWETYYFIVEGLVKCERMALAYRVYIHSLRKGVVSCRIFTLMMKAFYEDGRTEMAKEVYDEMIDKGVELDRQAYTTALTLFDRLKDLEKMEQIFDESKKKYKSVVVRTYNTLLHAYMNSRQPDKCRKILADMHKENVKPDHFVYTTMIMGYLQNDMGAEAKKEYEKAIADPNLSPNGKQEIRRLKKKVYRISKDA